MRLSPKRLDIAERPGTDHGGAAHPHDVVYAWGQRTETDVHARSTQWGWHRLPVPLADVHVCRARVGNVEGEIGLKGCLRATAEDDNDNDKVQGQAI